MQKNTMYDVMIIGGSYSGLSAALSLGRSLKQVLIIDGAKPCNRQTPHSHNFLTHDGSRPAEIAAAGIQDLKHYETVTFLEGFAVKGAKTDAGFEITDETGQHFHGKKLIIATGVQDLMPDIKGFAECWGITVIHCPFCHGYEVRDEKTGILGNGDFAFEFSRMILNWTKDLTVFTNGKSTITHSQMEELAAYGIHVNESEIIEFNHTGGNLRELVFKDGSTEPLKAIYAHLPFRHSTGIAEELGCELTESGHLKVDAFQKTNVPGVFACGDSTTAMRSVANAVGSGSLAGAMAAREVIFEAYNP